MSPLTGSPAVDAGNDSASDVSADQRGFSRRLGAHVDVGAVEGVYVTSLGSITAVTRLGNGSITFGFTNVIDANFQVLATTNLSLSTGGWTPIGFTTNNPAGSINYQFTDPQAANFPQRYYRVMAR